MTNPTRKKLIEVALPLEAINKAASREKSIRHGHPSTLHLWWARRPLAAARAVIFSQMVDDPSSYIDTLRSDPKLRRKAESTLKARKKAWDEVRRIAGLAAESKISAPAPGPEPELDEILAEQERYRLFEIIEELVKWENTNNPEVLKKANNEIWQSWRRACAENAGHPKAKELFNRNRLPAFHDPFAGGGALPLEAQRLGLESYASDLNPVAVLINKAMIEIPPKFANRPPVNPEAKSKDVGTQTWYGVQGLADDVRYYGAWMRTEAEKRIGHFYPKVKAVQEMDGSWRHATELEKQKWSNEQKKRQGDPLFTGESHVKELTVIAWLWARTVKSPNPAFANIEIPLISTFMLSSRPGKEVYIEPVIENNSYHFTVKVGKPKDVEAAKNGTKLARANFACLMSGTPISGDYIKAEGKAKRMGARLMGIVAESSHGRIYLAPTHEHEEVIKNIKPAWYPDGEIATRMTGGNCTPYGLTSWGDLFTSRQLVALTTFSDLIQEAREQIKCDAVNIGLPDDRQPLRENGAGATSYAEAVGVYLALAIDRMTNTLCTIARWTPERQQTVTAFARQAIPMTWDFPDVNPFANAAGDYGVSVEGVIKGIPNITEPAGFAIQADAATQYMSQDKIISTDPPYFDNIAYADLSDFFYVWMRRSLRSVFPELLATLTVPKAEELVATPYRHGGKEKAETFFLNGMTLAMHRLAEQAHPGFPVTIYYAFKQSEDEGADGTASTGWETFLDAVIRAGFAISGTWPMRTELSNRMIGSGTNALASSIILVCRQRIPSAPIATRREFIAALQAELPVALAHLQSGNIAPVDLAQSAIGPGIAIYTRYSKVLDAEGKELPVRAALSLINQTLDEVLAEQEGDFDSDTRWALAWFEQYGFAEGEYGIAETLSKAKNTSVSGMVEASIVESAAGKVRLFKPAELPAGWDPATDKRLTVWETVHHLIRVLESGGESAAAELAAKLGAKAEIARELAYRLYSICEHKKRAQEALSYNALVQSWPEVSRMAKESRAAQLVQPTFLEKGN